MSNPEKKKLQLRKRRAHRTRARLFGTAERPRLSVFRSNRHLYAQLINDAAGTTLCMVHDAARAGAQTPTVRGVARAKELGARLARAAQSKKVTRAVFDRGSYRYHGQVKALAEGAREAGLQL